MPHCFCYTSSEEGHFGQFEDQTGTYCAVQLQSAKFVVRAFILIMICSYEVRVKEPDVKEDIRDFVRQQGENSGIVYCLTTIDCEKLCQFLSVRRFNVDDMLGSWP